MTIVSLLDGILPFLDDLASRKLHPNPLIWLLVVTTLRFSRARALFDQMQTDPCYSAKYVT